MRSTLSTAGSDHTATIEDLKRQLREWTSNDADIPVRSNSYSYSSSSASIVDSPLPMSPYVSTAQLKPQLSLTQVNRNDGYPDGYSVSSLAFNLSQQMDYNNSLLREMETLEIKLASSDEQVQYLEAEVAQLSGSLRLSNEQTLQLEKQVHATVLQYETVVDENKALREEAKNSAAEAIRHSAQAEAQRRRSIQAEDGSSDQQQQVAHLQSVLLKDRENHKAEVDKYSRIIIDLEANLKRLEKEHSASGTSKLSKEHELHEVRDESIQLQREMNVALRQLQDDEGKLHELEKELKALQTQNLELSRSHQEMRFQLADRDETCIVLQARLNETCLQHDRADDEAQSGDAKWRRAEELLRQTTIELSDQKVSCPSI